MYPSFVAPLLSTFSEHAGDCFDHSYFSLFTLGYSVLLMEVESNVRVFVTILFKVSFLKKNYRLES